MKMSVMGSKVGDDGEGKKMEPGEEDLDWRNFQNAKTDHELLSGQTNGPPES